MGMTNKSIRIDVCCILSGLSILRSDGTFTVILHS